MNYQKMVSSILQSRTRLRLQNLHQEAHSRCNSSLNNLSQKIRMNLHTNSPIQVTMKQFLMIKAILLPSGEELARLKANRSSSRKLTWLSKEEEKQHNQANTNRKLHIVVIESLPQSKCRMSQNPPIQIILTAIA